MLPRVLQNPEVMAALARAAQAHNIPLGMLRVGNARNSINPHTGVPEFGIGDWFTGLFGGGDEQDPDGQGAAQGVLDRGAYTGIKSGAEQTKYVDEVQRIDQNNPYGSLQRAGIKAATREVTPPEVEAWIERSRPGTGAAYGSGGSVNKVDPHATEMAKTLGRVGRGMGVAGAALGLFDIATSDRPLRSAVANIGGAAGGLIGGGAGAAAGMLSGPGAFITAPASAIAGSVAGGMAGYEGGERLYDYVDERYKRWRGM